MSESGTFNESMGSVHNGARRVAKDAERGVEKVKRTASSELSSLIADVEDLLGSVADVADVDIARVKQRVQERLGSARETLAAGGKRITETARQAATATDDYVRESPWQALGVAALVGVLAGALLARR